MSGGERISRAIRAAAADGEPALVAYLTAGFPTRASFRAHVRALESAAHVIEIGVPFTDPMADGVTIQRASLAALAQGVTLEWILAELAALEALAVPLLLTSTPEQPVRDTAATSSENRNCRPSERPVISGIY